LHARFLNATASANECSAADEIVCEGHWFDAESAYRRRERHARGRNCVVDNAVQDGVREEARQLKSQLHHVLLLTRLGLSQNLQLFFCDIARQIDRARRPVGDPAWLVAAAAGRFAQDWVPGNKPVRACA
jgi:hypothetical protein